MMVVDVTTKPSLQVSSPRVQFDLMPYNMGDYRTAPNWDISPDGNYFVMVRDMREEKLSSQEEDDYHLNLITNFFAELGQRVPKR